jgi:hypothetical protein
VAVTDTLCPACFHLPKFPAWLKPHSPAGLHQSPFGYRKQKPIQTNSDENQCLLGSLVETFTNEGKGTAGVGRRACLGQVTKEKLIALKMKFSCIQKGEYGTRGVFQ